MIYCNHRKEVVTVKTEQFRINENSDFPDVYIIVNMDNQKVYIGSTRNICKRLKAHLYSLKKGETFIKYFSKRF
jgi:Mg-chelatase subunit ChlD